MSSERIGTLHRRKGFSILSRKLRSIYFQVLRIRGHCVSANLNDCLCKTQHLLLSHSFFCMQEIISINLKQLLRFVAYVCFTYTENMSIFLKMSDTRAKFVHHPRTFKLIVFLVSREKNVRNSSWDNEPSITYNSCHDQSIKL